MPTFRNRRLTTPTCNKYYGTTQSPKNLQRKQLWIMIAAHLLAYSDSRGKAMPNFRKLEPEEVQQIENKGKGQRKLTEEQYDAILAEYSIGDYGEALLDADENRLTVRNRLKAAARR